MKDDINWESPSVEDLGEAKDLIQNVFVLGTGDTEANMDGVLAPS